MDDDETRNRRQRLSELISTSFGGRPANLLAFIEQRTGKKPNQGEISGLLKLDNPSRSFGYGKAKTLSEQIGLNRRWFEFPPGSNLSKDRWMDDTPSRDEPHANSKNADDLSPSLDARSAARSAQSSRSQKEGGMKSNVVKLRAKDDEREDGYVRLEHLSPRPTMGQGAVVTEPVRIVQYLDVAESWVREEIGSMVPARVKVLTAVGRSMLPTIQDRDLVFVDVEHRHFDAPGIYVIDVAGRFLLKKVMMLADGTVVIRSDNTEEFPDEERYPLNQAGETITICGKVLGWWTLRKS